MNNRMRERFERWVCQNGGSVDRTDGGEYRSAPTECAWAAWLASDYDAEDRHSLLCAEWARICRSGRRHGAAVGANECANLLRGWRKNNEPLPTEPVDVRFNRQLNMRVPNSISEITKSGIGGRR